MFVLEVTMDYGTILRMLFINKRQADNARRKIAKEMAKGHFKNGDDLIEVKSDASTHSIAPSKVHAVSVNDQEAWQKQHAAEVERGKELGYLTDRAGKELGETP